MKVIRGLSTLTHFGVFLVLLFTSSIPVLVGNTIAFANDSVEMPLDVALSVIQARESEINTIEWRVQQTEADLSDSNDSLTTKNVSSTFTEGFVRCAPLERKFRAEFRSVRNWVNGADPYIAGEEAFSYDSLQYRQWQRKVPGTKVPAENHRVIAHISNSESETIVGGGFFSGWARSLGVGYVPPYFCPSNGSIMPLSEFLTNQIESGTPVSIETSTDGTWLIRTTHRVGQQHVIPLDIQYDPKKGAVTRAIFGGGMEHKEYAYQRQEVVLQNTDSGIWVPTEVRVVSPLSRPPTVTIFKYTDVRINAELKEDAFRIEFPTGTHVDDHIKEESYQVGVSPPEVGAATRAFMERHSLERGNGDAVWRRWMLWINVGIVVVIAAAIWVRRKSAEKEANRH